MTEVRNTKAFRAGKHINHEILQSSGSRTQIYWYHEFSKLRGHIQPGLSYASP